MGGYGLIHRKQIRHLLNGGQQDHERRETQHPGNQITRLSFNWTLGCDYNGGFFRASILFFYINLFNHR